MKAIRSRFNRIYQDYIEDFSQLEDFYPYHPLEFARRAQDLRSSYGFNRRRLVQELTRYNEALGAHENTLSSIAQLEDAETLAVVSGQQAGIFTGPLYTIYKAISLLKMVEKLQGKGLQVVPIFWVASEDHDFLEINHCYILNKGNRLQKIVLDQEETQAPVGTLPLDQKAIQPLLSFLEEETQETEFKGEVMELLYQTAHSSHTLVDWFSRLMLALFSNRGLILFHPLLEGLEEETIPFWEHIFKERNPLEQAMDRCEEELKKRGYSLQVNREEGRLPFFVTHEGKRQALFETKAGFAPRDKGFLWTCHHIQELIQKDPHCITSHVLTRPLLQEFLLPVLVYLGGPAEIAYQAQLKEAATVIGQRLPILFPRPGMTLLEGRVAEHFQKYGLDFSQVLTGLSAWKEKLLQQASPLDLSHEFGQLKGKWQEEYQALIQELGSIEKGLIPLGKKNLGRILKEVEYLEKKAHQAHRKKNQVLNNHFLKIEESLYPQKELQERVLNLFPFLIKYGFSFLEDLYGALHLETEHSFFSYRGDGDG